MIVDRPLTIGELFDRAVTRLVRCGVPVAMLTLVLVVAAVAQNLFTPRLTAHYDAAAIVFMFCWFIAEAVYAFLSFAAAVRLYGGESLGAVDALRAVVRDDPWRLVRLALLTGFIGAVGLWILGGLIGLVGGAASGAGVIVLLIVAGPVTAFFQLAFATCVLEGTPAVVSLGNAWSRAFAFGERRRSVLLLYAIILAEWVPLYGIDAIGTGLSRLFQLPLFATVTQGAGGPIGTAIGAALLTVAALDYRVRTQGADLEAALDGVP
ncbi:MAG TPA: hypothetical protein VMD91_12200 [Candidatus Sulfotelmatobacter sp.]|nr:hypothetical protein [Candidatus Sulfotelmatobacter sp.]